MVFYTAGKITKIGKTQGEKKKWFTSMFRVIFENAYFAPSINHVFPMKKKKPRPKNVPT